MITFRRLEEVLREDAAWIRIVLPGPYYRQEDYHGRQEIQRAVRLYGDCPVRRVQPMGYSAIIYLDH